MAKYNPGLMNTRREQRYVQTYPQQPFTPHNHAKSQQEVLAQILPGKEKITRGYTPRSQQMVIAEPAVVQGLAEQAATGTSSVGRLAAAALVLLLYASGCSNTYYSTNHRHADRFVQYSIQQEDSTAINPFHPDGTRKTAEEIKKEQEERRAQLTTIRDLEDLNGERMRSQADLDKEAEEEDDD